jgi:hypothetical protein
VHFEHAAAHRNKHHLRRRLASFVLVHEGVKQGVCGGREVSGWASSRRRGYTNKQTGGGVASQRNWGVHVPLRRGHLRGCFDH